jgi:TIR domain
VANLFFSYSHADESLRDQLEKHLVALQRQGIISSWHDRRITAGSEFADAIDGHLDAADVILLLISPDFIASDYCYEREMKRAMERHGKGEARVIPVILRPCDWKDLLFGTLLATPRDGRAITKWPNSDEAFLDVVTSIKRALGEMGRKREPRAQEPAAQPSAAGNSVQASTRSSNLRITKKFTDLDRDRFRHEGFEYIARFFENSLNELVSRNPGVAQTFRRIDANRFSAAAYRDGEKVCGGSASMAGGGMGHGSIEYLMSDEPRGGMNEAVSVKADDQTLYFEALGMQTYGREKEKLTFQGAAELFWELFIRPLQS